MYGEQWKDPAFNAIAFYLHVAGLNTREVADFGRYACEGRILKYCWMSYKT